VEVVLDQSSGVRPVWVQDEDAGKRDEVVARFAGQQKDEAEPILMKLARLLDDRAPEIPSSLYYIPEEQKLASVAALPQGPPLLWAWPGDSA
jgi:hypothetical protein